MKMRAKMVDGTPVTFESEDRGELVDGWDIRPGGKVRTVCVTEFVGEGFHVANKSDPALHPVERSGRDRMALERSGVDTATVEYLDSYFERRLEKWMLSDLQEHWVPLWPEERPSLLCRTPPTDVMVEEGYSVLRDFTEKIIRRGPPPRYRAVVRAIYEAMERARR